VPVVDLRYHKSLAPQKVILADSTKSTKFDLTMHEHFRSSRTQLAVLVDPDHQGSEHYEALLIGLRQWPADIILVGGSTSRLNNINEVCLELKANTSVPVILFPGNHFQLSPHADGVLTLSLISGRNPDYLIGRMVEAAPIIQSYQLDCLPTGYIMIGDSSTSATSYMTQTSPIPSAQTNIAAQTALAGQYIGMQAIYLEAGSGAANPIQLNLVNAVKRCIDIPLIVGGGIRNTKQVKDLVRLGVDTIVIGSALERRPQLLEEFYTTIIISNVYE